MSPFGSHQTMVCDDMLQDTILGCRRIIGGEVLLRDSDGYYVTNRNRLDSGLADPNRYGSLSARDV